MTAAYYHDATTAIAVIEAKDDRIRQLETENEALRATVKLVSEERGRLELELAQHRRMAKRLATEERMVKGD